MDIDSFLFGIVVGGIVGLLVGCEFGYRMHRRWSGID